MSPTPVTFGLPTQPASYSWEATDEEVAARFGIPIGEILRFDLNTSPAPPEMVAGILAGGAFDAPLSEYPPSDYRRLVETAAGVYGVATDELLVGAGADEILDLVGKAFLTPGGLAVIPTPTYAMYRVVTEQRGATAVLVARLGAGPGLRARRRRHARRRGRRRGRLAVQPEQPDGPARARRHDRRAPRWHRGQRRRGWSGAGDRRHRRGLRRVRRRIAPGPAPSPPERHRRPDRQQGLRPRRPPRRVRRRPARDDRPDRALSAAGIGVDGQRDGRDRGAGRPARDAREHRPGRRRAGSSRRGAAVGGLVGRADRHELPARRLRHGRSRRSGRDRTPPAGSRAADVRRGPSARSCPAPDDPRSGRQRPADRGGPRDRSRRDRGQPTTPATDGAAR